MALGVFPAVKLSVLFVKQISKPLAKLIVNQAKNHPVFRTYFIIPPAQFYHWAEVKTKMYVMNLGKPSKVAKLNEAMAIELGANLMGEIIIFGIVGSCIVLEYNRQVAKETRKEEARLAQIQKFTDDIESLHTRTVQLQSDIRYLKDAVQEIAKQTKSQLPKQQMLTEPDVNGNQPDSANIIVITEPINNEKKESLLQRALQYCGNNGKADKNS